MRAATEFVGTFLFLFVIALVGPSGSVLTPLAIGGALMVLVYMGGHRSGAHYNPAVSLALFLQKKITVAELVAYMIAQTVAGIAAFALGYAFTGRPLVIASTTQYSEIAVPAVEVIFTFLFVLVFMNVTASRRTEGNAFYGLAIGGTFAVATIAGGPISGGAFNPAVAIGAAVTAGNHDGATPYLLAGVLGPFVGAVLASYFWAAQEKSDPAPIAQPNTEKIAQRATEHPDRA